MNSLENRVGELERQNRTLKRSALVALVVVGGIVLMAQAAGPKVSETIEARGLWIMDEVGKPRMRLGTSKDGPEVSLYDEAGKPRAVLDVVQGGPALRLFDEAGKMRGLLTVDARGTVLALSNGTEKPGVSLSSLDNLGSSLNLFDKAGRNRASLDALEDGPALRLLDEMERERAGLSGVTKSGPRLDLYDQLGKMRVGLFASKDGATLELQDSLGLKSTLGSAGNVAPKAGAPTTRSAASLVMFDKEKNVIWQAP